MSDFAMLRLIYRAHMLFVPLLDNYFSLSVA